MTLNEKKEMLKLSYEHLFSVAVSSIFQLRWVHFGACSVPESKMHSKFLITGCLPVG